MQPLSRQCSGINDQMKTSEILQLLTAIVLAISALVQMGNLFLNFFLQMKLKSLDLEVSCQLRYHQILQDREQRLNSYEKGSPIDQRVSAENFFRIYWDHQCYQFNYYKDGFIDPRTYFRWMERRQREFDGTRDLNFPEMSFIEGWDLSSKFLQENDFRSFIDWVKEGKIERAFKNHPPKRRFPFAN